MAVSLATRYRDVPAHLRLERRVELAGLALLALTMLLLALVVVSALRTSSVGRISPSDDAIAVVPGFNDETVGAQESLEIRARPLFWISRRPEIPLPEALTAQTDDDAGEELKPLEFTVTGVFGAGSDNAGFIAAMKDEVRRVRLGDTLEGWTVARIGPTEVELVGGDTRRVVGLKRRPVTELAPPPPAETPQSDAARRGAASPAAGVEARAAEAGRSVLGINRLTLGGRAPANKAKQ